MHNSQITGQKTSENAPALTCVRLYSLDEANLDVQMFLFYYFFRFNPFLLYFSFPTLPLFLVYKILQRPQKN